MNQAVIGISLSYVILAALLVSIFILARVPVWIKFVCIVFVSSFYFITYSSLSGMLGWPTKQTIPDDFQLLSSVITEPDNTKGDKGSIHIWVFSFVENLPVKEPRAFKLPYTHELHASLEDALKDQRNGKVKLGRRVQRQVNTALHTDASRYANKEYILEFYDLPDPELPEK